MGARASPFGIRFAVVVLVASGLASLAVADPIYVYQGGNYLGSVEPYSPTTAMTGAANYNYVGGPTWSGDPITGPDQQAREGQIFFYNGSDGLSFTSIFNSIGGGPATKQKTNWDIAVTGSTADPGVLLSDNGETGGVLVEVQEQGATDVFQARWVFTQRTDGGVIGPLGGNSWSITIDPLYYEGPTALKVYSGPGSSITLNLNTDSSGDIVLTAIPEPFSMAFLGSAFVGVVSYRLRKHRKEAKK